MCTIIMVSLFSFPNGSDPPSWGFLTVKCTRVQCTVLRVSTNVYSAYHHCNQHQGCFLLPTSSLICPWHATLSHPGTCSHWSPLPRGTEVPSSEVTEKVMRLCLEHLSLACVVSVTEHYSVLCGHQDSHSAHSPDGRGSIKRLPLSILLTLFLKEHSFKISIKCIFFFFSFVYKQRVWCPP